MSWNLTNSEIKGVSGTTPAKQYAYWIRCVIEWREVWLLKDQFGWVVLEDPSGQESVPIWPHETYARNFAAGMTLHRDAKAQKITFEDFQEKWLPGMVRDGRLVVIGPFGSTQAVTKEPTEIMKDIERELKARF